MPTNPTENPARAPEIAVVEAFFEAFRRNDTGAALALMADDVVYQNVPFPPDRGKAAVARTFKVFERFMTSFDFEIKNIAARDGVVLTERVDLATGPLLDMGIWVCGTFEVRDGRIVLWRDYFDVASATAQLLTGPVRKLLGWTRWEARPRAQV